ncbi:hypothetical protein [Amycolatopsis sp. NPDC098790]|uniref:hypothetical protein n=1 Tax=Amycolatopsis sp. NPDC098790 TaxID=3363939 RepID=UPI0037F44FD9
MQKTLQGLVVGLSVALGLTTGSPAFAADYLTKFYACHTYEVNVQCGPIGYSNVVGTIKWLNRTATLGGFVQFVPDTTSDVLNIQAVFDAFKGSTRIESQTRTVDLVEDQLQFGFTIGDPDLVGGIDRIRITVVYYTTSRERIPGDQLNCWRHTSPTTKSCGWVTG